VLNGGFGDVEQMQIILAFTFGGKISIFWRKGCFPFAQFLIQ
jgi:hypothetical protein